MAIVVMAVGASCKKMQLEISGEGIRTKALEMKFHFQPFGLLFIPSRCLPFYSDDPFLAILLVFFLANCIVRHLILGEDDSLSRPLVMQQSCIPVMHRTSLNVRRGTE